MATASDLGGLGVALPLAALLGNTPNTSVTAAGTSSTTATTLTMTNGYHNFTVTAASSQTGVILDANMLIGDVVYVTCTSSTTAILYPMSGATFNLASNTSISVAQYKTVIAIRTSATTCITLLTA